MLDEELLLRGSREFSADHWALFDLSQDFSEADDVAAKHPDIVRRLEARWLEEAERNQVMPIDDGLVQRLGAFIQPAYPPKARSVFVPGGSPITDECLPFLFGGFHITAEANAPEDGGQGVLFALGDWHGGFALYVLGGRPVFAFSNAGEIARAVPSPAAGRLTPGRHSLAATFRPSAPSGGIFTLWCDGDELASSTIGDNLVIALQHGGTAMCLGRDRGFPVCDDYQPPFPWTGTIDRVVVETPGFASPAADDEVRAALHGD